MGEKSATVQRVMADLNANRRQLLDKLHQCAQDIAALDGVLKALQFNEIAVTRVDLFGLLKQQALLAQQRQSVEFECNLYQENVAEIDSDLAQCQRQLATRQRKEMKFSTRDAQRQTEVECAAGIGGRRRQAGPVSLAFALTRH